ncbi:PAS domain-containing protein [Archangium violaceum]|uniref:two-component system sensor histidine kinase NtrB n=1 Tax=Archangium violaceum TaxID=83451 RepID=UPI00193C43BF|nr:ATP-binding protein [Archangium violaceum]QRK09083.1 PAS domain-containing protein [Archangium violaceum]
MHGRGSPRDRVLGLLDAWLTDEQRQLPPAELGRFRVVVGATGLLLVLNLLLLPALASYPPAERLPVGLSVLVNGLCSGGVLWLVRRLRSPTLPAFLLCASLSTVFILTTLVMGEPGTAVHAATMLIPALTVYLLGPVPGLVFTTLFVLNAALFHELGHWILGRPLPALASEWFEVDHLLAGVSLLGGWLLNWLHSTTREESHAALERALRTLRESEGKLLSLIDSTDDVVLALDLEGRVVATNHVAKGLFHAITGQEFQPGVSFFELAPPALRTMFQEHMARALEGQRLKFEAALPLADRLRTLEITFNPVREGERVVGMTVFSRDISERKEAEARLEEMHRSLLDVSRHAGMAEIATGVLHNVGNTLNSVNVSANLVSERVRGSRVAGLERAVELLRENGPKLAAFLTEDPRGRQLPAYLEALSAQLKQEREGVLEEMRRLGESVDHIKSVVSMQQKHARFSGILERVEVPGLIDDALRLHAVAIERLGIQLRREYGAQIPPVLVDRHKLLQILVNLVSNARHALLESGRQDKQLTLSVERVGEKLRISVADNGVGIAPENVSRLFTQGFTTKKEGHGFGLHISALAAEEMGGALMCESGGPGQGATFTLELPLT